MSRRGGDQIKSRNSSRKKESRKPLLVIRLALGPSPAVGSVRRILDSEEEGREEEAREILSGSCSFLPCCGKGGW